MAARLKPTLRALKYAWLYRKATWQASSTVTGASTPEASPPEASMTDAAPTAFVVGCGRSGTTILGSVLSTHPQIKYRFEPYHLWAALDVRSDVLNLYHSGPAQLMMDEHFANEASPALFSRLFGTRDSRQLLVEKTPLNVFRIGYLRALAPNAKFVHIVRDGVDVAHSISRLATGSPYKIAGKPDLNQWWGVAGKKWESLKAEGAQAGYWPDEVDGLRTHVQRGAYEWLTSLAEMDRWRPALADQLHEIVYEQFIYKPEKTLGQLCDFLGLATPADWLDAAAREIRLQTPQSKTVTLPQEMAAAFNQQQQRYGFSQRAIAENSVASAEAVSS